MTEHPHAPPADPPGSHPRLQERRGRAAARDPPARQPPQRLSGRVVTLDARPAPAAPPHGTITHTHRVGSPTGTAFKLGLGFAAGVLAVRAVVALVAGIILILVVSRLLAAVTG